MARLPLLLLACTLFSACSHTAIEAARQDAQLMEQIARANIAEIAAGNMAFTKGASPEVRQLGERAVDEHSALLKAGSGVAAVAVPTTPGARHEPALAQLQSLSGAAFDRAFLEQMVRHNEETLRLLQLAAAHAGDPGLRAYAQRAMPHLERQLAAARRILF
jgi:putative membrane protein